MTPLDDTTDDIRQKTTEDELRLVKLVVQDLLQTLKTFQVYEADHPLLVKFLDRLKKDFDSYFEKNDALLIQLDERNLLYAGKRVYESQDVKESLAFMFFKDGIREMSFFKGLGRNEILDFLAVVRNSNVVDRMEDDLVTLLWSKEFLHIDFTITDDFFEGENILIPLTEEDLIKGLEYRGFEEQGEEGNVKRVEPDLKSGEESRIGFGAGTGKETGSTGEIQKRNETGIGDMTALSIGAGGKIENISNLVVEGLRQMLHLSSDRSLAQVCALTPDEIEKIYKRADKEEQMETLFALISNFTEILLHLSEDTKTYDHIVSYFERIIESLMEEGEVQKVVTLLKNFHRMMARVPLKEKQKNAVQHILQIASDAHSIELLGKTMRKNQEADWEPINQYLELLTKQAIDPLCLLLGTLDTDRSRSMVRERLAVLCGGTITPLLRFLSNANASLVTDLLYVLGKIDHPSTLTYLTPLASHRNSKIREEVFRLATVLTEGRKALIQKFLRDPLPEIRGKAAIFIGRTEGEQAVGQLKEIILSKHFYRRTYEEKLSFFTALGETGSEEAIPVLGKIIKTKRWFNKEQWDEMKNCASFALRMIESRKESQA